ncbi:MAG: DUF167 domain-containing protein [Burkholderiaceae bacterium]|jgi:uncharacterized protein (TIGR00251 family)|nr:DUF167 domain-containing protein [Burkholderiaceae bacterium]
MGDSWLVATASAVRITVWVSPNAKVTEVLSASDSALRIRLKAPPVEGKANEELIRFVAKKLGLPKGQVRITHGTGSRRKRLEVPSTLSADDIKAAFFAGRL